MGWALKTFNFVFCFICIYSCGLMEEDKQSSSLMKADWPIGSVDRSGRSGWVNVHDRLWVICQPVQYWVDFNRHQRAALASNQSETKTKSGLLGVNVDKLEQSLHHPEQHSSWRNSESWLFKKTKLLIIILTSYQQMSLQFQCLYLFEYVTDII